MCMILYDCEQAKVTHTTGHTNPQKLLTFTSGVDSHIINTMMTRSKSRTFQQSSTSLLLLQLNLFI